MYSPCMKSTPILLAAGIAGLFLLQPAIAQQQYPALSLEEVYGAIAYYLAHKDEVHTYLKQQDALWEAWRAKSAVQSHPVVERLRALRTPDAPKPI